MNLLYLVLPFALSTSFAHQDIKTYKFNFDTKDSFTVAYADYPKGQEAFYELKSEAFATLPREITTSTKGLKISGNNHSDDLFMFAYKKITGLKPNTQYQVSFSVEFASNGPVGSSGIGGSPGDAVYVKIGAVTEKPKRYLDEEQMYRIGLDKGNQASDGADMILIGNLAVDIADNATDYRLKTLPYQPDAQMQDKLEHYTVTSNAQGEVWLVFGTDSGYEGLTKVYYTNLTVGFKEV
ncbi:MAG: hypothetical protein WC627_02810 [Legionella sp.]|jgi:hypothetical protein